MISRFIKNEGYEEIYGELVNNPDYSKPEVLVEFYKKMNYRIEYKNLGMQFAEISKKLQFK